MKGDGGAIGLTDNSAELVQWMVFHPGVARLILEFEASQESIKAYQRQRPNSLHIKYTKGVKVMCSKQVAEQCRVIMGTPLCVDSNDLLVVDTWNIVNEKVIMRK